MRSRHRNADDILGPDRIHGDAGRQRRINPTGETYQDTAESALAKIVARPEYQRFIHGFGLVIEVGALVPGERNAIEDDKVFGKGCGRSHHPTGGIHRKARPVEDKLIVPADEVDVDQRNAVTPGHGAEDLAAQLALAHVPRRCVDGYKDTRSGLRQLLDRIALIEAPL